MKNHKIINNDAILKIGLQLMIFVTAIILLTVVTLSSVSYVVNVLTLKKASTEMQRIIQLEQSLYEKGVHLTMLVHELEKQRLIANLKDDLGIILRDQKFDVSLINESHLYFMESQRVKYNIPKHIYYRTIFAESRFRMLDNNGNVLQSHAGALGYMQLLRSTFSYLKNTYDLGINDITDPYHNIVAGSFYLRMRKDNIERAFPGSSENTQWKLTLSAYNAGIGKVLEARGVPDIQETINYVNFIMMNFSGETYASLNE